MLADIDKFTYRKYFTFTRRVCGKVIGSVNFCLDGTSFIRCIRTALNENRQPITKSNKFKLNKSEKNSTRCGRLHNTAISPPPSSSAAAVISLIQLKCIELSQNRAQKKCQTSEIIFIIYIECQLWFTSKWIMSEDIFCIRMTIIHK